MYLDPDQLAQFLLSGSVVSRASLERARSEAGVSDKRLEEVLIARGDITADGLRKVSALMLGIPFLTIDEKIAPNLLSLVPEPIARRHNIVPIKLEGDLLSVAMLDTEDLSALDFVTKKTGHPLKAHLTDTVSIKKVLKQYQSLMSDDFTSVIASEVEKMQGQVVGADRNDFERESGAIKIVDTILQHALIEGASDIHLETHDTFIIRYRIDGLLHDIALLPKDLDSSIVSRLKVLGGVKLDEKRLPQDGRFSMEYAGESVSFRLSTLPTFNGEKIVLRILRETASGFSLESLGVHGEALEVIHSVMKKPSGLILVVGPTGSGKTTTLYTLLDILNSPSTNISTIEDPIEYHIPRVNQTQVHDEIGYSFSNGLRSLLRQDPNILMVGEIRDRDTAHLAISAALTGHLVLSSLHTTSAVGAITRLLDFGIEPYLINAALRLVVSQRLVRRLKLDAPKRPLSLPDQAVLNEQVDMSAVLKRLKDEKIVSPDTTQKSLQFGVAKEDSDYQGRFGIFQTLLVNESLRQAIISRSSDSELESSKGVTQGATVLEDGLFRVAEGSTTLEEVMRVVAN
jgi:type IV pilus assembly protein PilB